MSRLTKREAEHYRLVIDNYRHAFRIRGTYELAEAIDWGISSGNLTDPLDVRAWHLARAAEALRTAGKEPNEDGETDGRERLNVIIQDTDPESQKPRQRSLWGDTDDPDVPDEFKVEAVRQQLARVQAHYLSVQKTVDRIIAARPSLRPRLTQMLLDFNPRGEGEDFAAAGH